MKQLIFLGMVFAGAVATADTCQPFVGHWAGTVTGGVARYSEIEIQYDASTAALAVTYDSDSAERKFTENYVADGQKRRGDPRYTGDTYTATCAGNKLALVRDFAGWAKPMDTDFTLTGDELSYESFVEGSPHGSIEKFKRLP